MDIYLDELYKTVAYHDDDCDCRDCAMYYFLIQDQDQE